MVLKRVQGSTTRKSSTFYPPQGESPESSTADNKRRGQLEPHMNGSEEAGGATKGSTTFKNMKKQPTSPVRAKMVRYGRHTNFGAAGDNDEDIGTTYYTSNSNMPTPDGDDSVRQPQRPLPSPEPPPSMPCRPKPGTGKVNVIQQQRATQEPITWNNASHQRQQTQKDATQRTVRKSLLEEQGDLYDEIYPDNHAN